MDSCFPLSANQRLRNHTGERLVLTPCEEIQRFQQIMQPSRLSGTANVNALGVI